MCAPTLVLFPLLCDPAAQPEEQQILRPPPSLDTILILILTTSARGVHLTTFSSRSSLARTGRLDFYRPTRPNRPVDRPSNSADHARARHSTSPQPCRLRTATFMTSVATPAAYTPRFRYATCSLAPRRATALASAAVTWRESTWAVVGIWQTWVWNTQAVNVIVGHH